MYAPFKAHSMSKDDRATSARRKRRKDPVADRAGKGGKPIMVKTDVKEGKMSAADRFAKRLKDKHGMDLDAKLKYYEDMKKKMQQTSAKGEVRRKQLGGNATLGSTSTF